MVQRVLLITLIPLKIILFAGGQHTNMFYLINPWGYILKPRVKKVLPLMIAAITVSANDKINDHKDENERELSLQKYPIRVR